MVCQEELDEIVEVEPGQDKYTGMTAEGITRIWPNIKDAVTKHEGRCRGKGS